jgi:DNA-binding response OmpR family regulator
MQSPAFDKIKTLIVEDDKSVLTIYKIGLREEVFEKNFLTNGNDALEAYLKWKPDILILDIMLPGTSGYAILKAIKEEAQSVETAIMMATSLSDREAVLDCLSLGIQGYIVKPFTHKEVSQRVLGYYRKTNPERAEAALALLDALNEASAADNSQANAAPQNEPIESETPSASQDLQEETPGHPGGVSVEAGLS